MKRIFAISICAIMCVMLLASCEKSCVHTYGEWQYDETYHWCDWSCSLDLCDIDTTGEHIDKDGDSVCDTCNYIILNCVHTYGEWQYNETHHWRDWSCSLNMCRIETTGEHFDEDKNGVCDKCGYFLPNDMDDAEVPEVLIKIEKWNGDKFEGIVANPLFSYLEVGDKVSVICENETIASESQYSTGTLVVVRFGRFDANVQPNILYAEAVENGEKYANGIRIYDCFHPDDSERNRYFSVTLPTLHNATVERREGDKIYIDGEYLLGGSGNGCDSFYLSDLTGDGFPELCFCMNFGSGIVTRRVQIIDYKTKTTIFTLPGSVLHDYCLFLRNGTLCVKEIEYRKQDAIRTGVLKYNGTEFFVEWDAEVNTTFDRDSVSVPGEPIS